MAQGNNLALQLLLAPPAPVGRKICSKAVKNEVSLSLQQSGKTLSSLVCWPWWLCDSSCNASRALNISFIKVFIYTRPLEKKRRRVNHITMANSEDAKHLLESAIREILPLCWSYKKTKKTINNTWFFNHKNKAVWKTSLQSSSHELVLPKHIIYR